MYLFIYFILFFFRKPVECNVENEPSLTITEVEEGSEPDAFFKALGGKKYYCSLIKGTKLLYMQLISCDVDCF